MSSIIVPKALDPGATIAFISPSARLNDQYPAAVLRATAVLKGRGYNVREFYNKDIGIQSSIINRISELRAACLDTKVSAIICTVGGPSFTELLPGLIADTDLHNIIRANPKIVLGASESVDDETLPLAFCIKHLFRAIADREPIGDVSRSPTYAHKHPSWFHDPASIHKTELVPTPGWIWLRPGKAQGRLFGGCLSVMARLNGVRQIVPDWRGRIIFFETATGEKFGSGNPIDRVKAGIADLIAQGVFEDAAGLVVGRPFGYDSTKQREKYISVIKGLLCDGPLSKKEFPILFNVDVGHTTPMVTLPFDALAILDSEKDQFAVQESGVV
ncbi:peptidase [Daldinia decipiens]|uniref:peptidase n=1 Tax=Daldinia decipiens TaxID=326647 RepID=UPI0020C2CD9F|nr:peptidase [Daldinia decipiens]KAI1656014.1 peptidase [Daldinia decipiens]